MPINWKVIQRLQWLYPPTAQKFFVNMMGILCDRVERLTTCLANESLVDDLTGLNNRKGFVRALEQEANRAYRLRENLVMAMIKVQFTEADGNHFDGIKNDIMRAIGDTLTATIRRCDMVGRIDTNTFAVLTSSTAVKDTRVVMQRLGRDLEKLPIRFEETVVFSIALNAAVLRLEADNNGEQLIEETWDRMVAVDDQLQSFITGSAN